MTTYEVFVRHQADNTVENRVVSNASGKWARITPSAPFTVAPAEGDLWAVGVQAVDIIPVVLQKIDRDGEGDYTLNWAEYIPAIFTEEPLPPKSVRRFFGLQPTVPIPLRDARVLEEIAQNSDGSFSSILHFAVTPGLPKSAGTAQAGAAGSITLAAAEPDRDDYYTTATIRITAGTGAGQEKKISSYTGSTRVAVPDTSFSPAPDATSEYEIEWEKFGDFAGFKVELADDAAGPWTETFRADGDHYEVDGRAQGGVEHFRYTPISSGLAENLRARPVITITTTGDQSAPAAPASVAMSSHLKTVTTEVVLNLPLAEDLAGVEIEIYRTSIGGTLLKGNVRLGVPQDNAGSGTITVRHSVELASEAYGAVIISRARTVDNSNNPSAWTDAGAGTTLTRAQTEDLEDGSVTQQQEGVNDASAAIAADSSGGTDVATISITTNGGTVLILATAECEENSGTDSITLRFRIKRDGTTIKGPHDIFFSAGRTRIAYFMVTDTPAAGTYTYKYNIGYLAGGSNDAVARLRQVIAVETLK